MSSVSLAVGLSAHASDTIFEISFAAKTNGSELSLSMIFP
jgi:hypothetical protein